MRLVDEAIELVMLDVVDVERLKFIKWLALGKPKHILIN